MVVKVMTNDETIYISNVTFIVEGEGTIDVTTSDKVITELGSAEGLDYVVFTDNGVQIKESDGTKN